jgi:hypothetical protein
MSLSDNYMEVLLSFLRMQESNEQHQKEIPAYAGMTIFRTTLYQQF